MDFFFFPDFFERITLIGSGVDVLKSLSGTSYCWNEERVVWLDSDGQVGVDTFCGVLDVVRALAGISPSLSMVNDRLEGEGAFSETKRSSIVPAVDDKTRRRPPISDDLRLLMEGKSSNRTTGMESMSC